MKAIWENIILAESNATIVVEGNHYFPPDSINKNYFKDSNTQTTCPWKGLASYYSIVVNGKVNQDAAWYYPDPKPAAGNIKNYVAFWKGIEVVE
jgi:uncharacterized protein (DUF427 family)